MKNIIRDLVAGVAFGVTTLLFSGTIAWADLPEKPTSPQTEENIYPFLKQQREERIKALEKYASEGKFPYGKEGSPELPEDDPHFDPFDPLTHRILGPNGVLCALAHLISESGHDDLVKLLAKEANHFCVGKDKHKAVEKWILSSGLTPKECIDIQRPGAMRIEERPPEDPAFLEMVNQRRIQGLLWKVIRDLKRNSEKSLSVAVERYRKAKS